MYVVVVADVVDSEGRWVAGVQTSVDGGACPAILHCVKSGRKRSVEKCVCSD